MNDFLSMSLDGVFVGMDDRDGTDEIDGDEDGWEVEGDEDGTDVTFTFISYTLKPVCDVTVSTSLHNMHVPQLEDKVSPSPKVNDTQSELERHSW